jgi:hypothetical protein
MTLRCQTLLFWLITAGAVLTGLPVQAASYGLRVSVLGLKSDALQPIEEQIAAIHSRFQKDLLIEAVDAVPPEREKEMKALKQSRFFALWAEERALAAGVDGVYVLICNAPRHIQVYVSPDSREVFSTRTQDRLRKTLDRKFTRRDFYGGLADGVTLVREQLEESLAEPKRSDWVWIVWVILGTLGLWMVIALVRRFVGPRGAQEIAPPVATPTAAVSAWRQDVTQSWHGPAKEG